MLALANFGKDTGAGALPFETTKSAVQAFIFLDSNFRHFYPSLASKIRTLVIIPPKDTMSRQKIIPSRPG